MTNSAGGILGHYKEEFIFEKIFLVRGTYYDNVRGSLWGTISCRNPSVSKSNHLHVVTFQFLFIDFETYHMDSFKMMDGFLKALELQLVISQSQPVHL
jgi:hypothetical protein